MIVISERSGNDEASETARYTYGTWTDLAAAVQRFMLISVLRPALDEERALMSRWKASALNNTPEYGEALRAISRQWANCGETTRNVLARLRDNYDATISLTEVTDFKAGTSQALAAKLNSVPGSPAEIYILDCDLQGIHNFLVEAHSDGSRYLVQGYQGGYSALWWVTDSAADPTDDRTDRSDVLSPRKAFGNGNNITPRYANFVKHLCAVVDNGFAAKIWEKPVWPQLPFRPADKAVVAFNDLPYLRVSLYRVRNPQAVRDRMRLPAGSVCVQAVLSLPLPPRPVDPLEVIAALGRLGLQATHTVEQRSQTDKFKIDADTTGQHPGLAGKLAARVGAKEIGRITSADLPPNGQTVDFGYTTETGVEMTVTRTVQ